MEVNLDLKIETTKSEQSTLKVVYEDKTLYLHSKYNPMREAETWAKDFYKKGRLSIIIGLGLGYYVKALLNIMDKDDRILVIEPYEEIFSLAKENVLGEVLDDSQVFVCLAEDKKKFDQILRILIMKHFLKSSQIFIAPNYDKIAEVETIISRMKKAFGDYAVDINTKLLLAFDWQQNHLRNMKDAIQSCPITVLEKKFTCPVLIVSAGPSLQKELARLRDLYMHAFIISAGSATPVLLKNGVKPHMIVSIDGSIEMYDHFKDVNYEDIPLCYTPAQNYKIVKQHKGLKIIFQAQGTNIVDWYNEVIGFTTGIVPVGPSVANFCLDIACRLTSGPICFIGQDLGYVGGFSHAEGNNNRVSSAENQGLIPVESNDGTALYTDYAFGLMREWFEKYLQENSRDHVYNASQQGAKIKGTTFISFDNFIQEFCQQQIDVEQDIKTIVTNWEKDHNNEAVDIGKVMEELTESLQKVILRTGEASELAQKLLTKVKNRDDDGINKLLKKLSKTDEKIMALKNKDGLLHLIIQMIVDILIMWDEEDEDDYKKRMKIAEKNHFFYSNLHKMSKEVRKMFDDIKSEEGLI